MNQSVFVPNQLTQVKMTSALGQWQKRLGGLLAAQLILAGAIFAWQEARQPDVHSEPLMAVKQNEVDKLVITEGQNSVTLQKVNGQWQLPQVQQLPVDEQKLTGLLDKLANTQLTWPVATTGSSHERFEVSEQKFQRKINAYKADQSVVEFYLGTSPSFKKVHLRKQGDKTVYAVGLSAFDFYSTAPNWLKKDLLALADVQTINGSDFSLRKTANGWSLEGSNDSVDKNKADDLAAAFAKLAVLEPADNLPNGEPRNLTVTAAGQPYQFTLVKADNQYFIRRGDKPQVFKISQADYDRLTKPVKNDLLAKPTTTGANLDPVGQMLQQSTEGIFKAKPAQ
ncbi:MAG TPA: DUF4340 domain-containing protein [Cellvibrionaceae bacterium]|nr:DUF4340 domain-containing protein [Cellvibrionaceae bacterium]